jgi:hypothetical protein
MISSSKSKKKLEIRWRLFEFALRKKLRMLYRKRLKNKKKEYQSTFSLSAPKEIEASSGERIKGGFHQMGIGDKKLVRRYLAKEFKGVDQNARAQIN